MRELLRDLVRIGRVVPTAGHQRLGYLCAALLMLSGVFHGLVQIVDGGNWQGPVSWRKPTVFGLSFGITLATLTWLLGFLRPSRRAGWIVVGILSLASVGEVLLVSMQKWRGVPSHFNESTAFDAGVFSTVGSAQVLPALALLALASELTECRRLEIVGLGALGYASVITSTMVQTYAGAAPLDLTLTSSALAAAGLVLLGASALLALRGLSTRSRPPVGSPPGTMGPAVPG